MAKPYSADLRRRVGETIEGGTTIPEAAEQCGVSISSVVRFLKLHRETGSVDSAKFGGYKDFALAAHEDLVRQAAATCGQGTERQRILDALDSEINVFNGLIAAQCAI